MRIWLLVVAVVAMSAENAVLVVGCCSGCSLAGLRAAILSKGGPLGREMKMK